MTIDDRMAEALETIPALAGKVYPLNALQNTVPPYALFVQGTDDDRETLEGASGLLSADFDLYLVARTVSALDNLGRAVKAVLRGLGGTEEDGILIERATVRQTAPDDRARDTMLTSRVYDVHFDYQEE